MFPRRAATRFGPAAAILLVAMLLGASPAAADAVSNFFSGKQITMLIGSTPGGGYDAYARLLSRHLGRHVPGNPEIVPKNMPGADGLLLANYIYNKGPRDGTEIATLSNGVPFERLFQTLSPGGSNALFDSTKFGWIGSVTQSVYLAVTWHDAPVKTIADAMKQETVFGATASSSDSYVLAMLLNRMLGTKFKIVLGYDGASAVDLAMEKGEIQGEAGKDWTTMTATRPYWLSEKKVNLLIQLGLRSRPEIPEVPLLLDLVKSADDRKLAELIFAKYGMSRPYFVAPNLPGDRLAALRRAFDETMVDPAFQADAGKAGMELSPVAGAEVEALVSRIMAAPDALVARARAALKP
jgi:tripartite-type tricarboxylate transporter receptor subunit TctC